MSNPNVGMMYPVWAPMTSHTDGSMPVYGTGRVLQEARNATITKEISDNPLYGDDHIVDNDNGMTGLTVSFESTGLSDADRAAVLGDELRTDGEYWESDNASPKGCLGYIRKMRDRQNGGSPVRKFEAWLILCVQLAEQTQTTTTREGQINWGTPTLTGRGEGLYVDDSGNVRYRLHKTFDTASAAKAWLNSLANISASTT